MLNMRHLFIAIALLCSMGTMAQIPAGYYDPAMGLTGEPLRDALMNIIDNHSVQSYSSLHTHFQTTDDSPDGDVWDMYSENPAGTDPYNYNFGGGDQCGNYGSEGDCYNREHSFPKSWFGNVAPMASDLFHLYPTDGYVNGQRNNYPYSEVDNPTWTSSNGSKRGTSSYPGYSGNAFEPIDEYKGDFARTYFYMVTRYKTSVAGWSSAMLSGDNYSEWATNLLLQWSADDAVDQKEIDRNNAIYAIQGNRNPFIDHPEWISDIWQSTVAVPQANEGPEWKVFAHDKTLHVENTKGITKLTLIDILGRPAHQWNIDGNSYTYRSELPTGVYFVRLEQAGVVRTYRIHL